MAVDTEASLTTEQAADVLGFTSLLRAARTADSNNKWQRLYTQQQLLAAVQTASLQVDATTGQIDEEIAETHELENYLNAKRAKEIDLLNLASLAIGGTLGTASAALGLTPHLHASGVIGITAGSSITVLSVLGLHVRKGSKDTLEARSNMLSRIFDLDSDPNNYYPKVVADFMNTAAPNDPDGLSRKLRLVRSWEKLGRIPDPQSTKGREKVARLASVPRQNTRLTIGDLDDRQAMLYDLRARLTYMKRDLAALLALPSAP